MMKVPAYLVLRGIALVLTVAGFILLYMSSGLLSSNIEYKVMYDFVLMIAGIILLIIGVGGPLRIIKKKTQLPAEVKQMIAVQAWVLPLLGIVCIASGVFHTQTVVALTYFTNGLLLLISARYGFYVLSNALPHTFHIDEMLSIVKSTGIIRSKNESMADVEFIRWTQGIRYGVQLGQSAPDGGVITLQGKTILLSSYFDEKLSAPLVLNFASYTCPHHRKRIDELHTLVKKWQKKGVDFLTIYTAEAHPEDGWKLKLQYKNDFEYTNEDEFQFYYAKNNEDRIHMANWLIQKKDFQMPVVIDNFENTLLRAYNTWPIRLYIIQNNMVVYCGKQGPFGYDPGGVDKALESLLK